MKLTKYLLVLSALLLNMAGARAQTRTALEDEAYMYLNSKEYKKAYEAFDKLYARYPKEMLYEFNLGVCCLNYSPKKDRAIEIFKDLKAKYNTLEAEAYLGIAYHRNYRFDEAIATLNPVVEQLSNSRKKEDLELLNTVKMTIFYSENGKKLIDNKVFADIQNIGGPINTPETEGVPIITTDEGTMIFTYVGEKSLGGKMGANMKKDDNGEYLSDIYISSRDSSGKWSAPEPVKALNTEGNDAAIALSPDGSTLFTFLSNNENEGDIMMSKLNGREFSPPVPLNANINTPEYWEGSCSISADGRFLYFSSERPNGLGGRDLYVSEMVNGDWGPPLNLGPKINTIYDDDAPFIHPDGITLFFSSKGHNSIGGYDIMYAIKEGNDWTEPRSMGIPLNTPEDDSYYVINSRGDTGFFSSTRNAKGAQGGQDIYMVTPGILGEKPVVALLKGTVYGDDKPVAGKIEVLKTARQENIGPYYSNNESGKYLMALSPGYIYRITVKAEGFNTIEEDFDVENLGTYMEKHKDFYLYSSKPSVTTESTIVAGAPAATAAPAAETASTPAVETASVAAVETTSTTLAAADPATLAPEPAPQMQKPDSTGNEPVLPKTGKQHRTEKTAPEKYAATEKTGSGKKSRSVETACNSEIPDLQRLRGASLNDEKNYREMLSLMGNYCNANIRFAVQIGAYKHPEKFNYRNLKELGEVSTLQYGDSLTRFIQSEHKTINEAEKHRQKAISKGVKDAWIIAFVDGKRYTLEDLIMVDFMGKPVN